MSLVVVCFDLLIFGKGWTVYLPHQKRVSVNGKVISNQNSIYPMVLLDMFYQFFEIDFFFENWLPRMLNKKN